MVRLSWVMDNKSNMQLGKTEHTKNNKGCFSEGEG